MWGEGIAVYIPFSGYDRLLCPSTLSVLGLLDEKSSVDC
jgi:hypothetical protein